MHKNGHSVSTDPAGQFAFQIAEALDDIKNLALYRSYCDRFPVGMILRAFFRAKETPNHKIRVSRGALFNFLVQLYAGRKNKNNSGLAAG